MSNLRVMWMSNAPWCGTGYGVQASKVIPFLKEHPSVEDVSLFAFYGVSGGITRQLVGKHWVTCYPCGAAPYGHDVVNDWMKHSGSNVLITLLDIFVMPPDFGTSGYYWLPYAPIDFEPIPQVFIDRFKNSYRPIVYSQFAVKEMKKVGLECFYAPHGVETKIFKPHPSRKQEDKKWAGLDPDSFVVGMDAANKDAQDRKGFHEAMQAFVGLLDKYENCQLYLHALVTPEMGGLDLLQMAKTYGIVDKCRFTLKNHIWSGLCREDMAKLYNSFDVFLNPCHRAGFEIPLVEAQACGVPIIAGGWHSMPELCGAGWLIKPAQKVATPLESFIYIPSVPSITEHLLDAYDHWGDKKMSKSAREFAVDYDWQNVLSKYWGPIITTIGEELMEKTRDPIPANEIRMMLDTVRFEGQVKEVVDGSV